MARAEVDDEALYYQLVAFIEEQNLTVPDEAHDLLAAACTVVANG